MADLITKEIYKQSKMLTSSKEDERLDIIIPAVNHLVKSYCNNSFNDYVTEDKEEYHTVEFFESKIMLEEYPVISITSVYERAHETDDYVELTTDEYILNRKTDSIVRIGPKWPIGVESVKVLYNAGYTETPQDLLLALIDLVHYYMKEEYKENRTMMGASMQNITTSSLNGNIGFPNHIKRILDMYRKI